jgi:enamine deaminase RidA (YjgF/YER057c/UK114 family)
VRRDLLSGIAPTPPTDQYVPAVAAGARLFVAGHDPELEGRLVYRGRVGEAVSAEDAREALRLATANALAAAGAVAGPLDRLRCVVLTGFVASAAPAGLDPALLGKSLALLAAALPAGGRPAVWLRPAQGLAGGMTVEVELVLEARLGEALGPRALSDPERPRRGAPAIDRARRRSEGRTS